MAEAGRARGPMARRSHLSPPEEGQGAGAVVGGRSQGQSPAPPRPPERPRHGWPPPGPHSSCWPPAAAATTITSGSSSARAPLALALLLPGSAEGRPLGSKARQATPDGWRRRGAGGGEAAAGGGGGGGRRRGVPPPAMEPPEPGAWKARARPREAPPAGGGGRRRQRLLLLLRCCPSLPKRQWRLLAAGLTCCTVLALCALGSLQQLRLPGGRRSEAAEEGDDDQDDGDGEPVTVLLWWQPFGREGDVGGCRRRFNISACRLTGNRSRLLEAGAVLFHHRDLVAQGRAQLPRQRPAGQRWVWMNFESPSHSPGLRELGGLFNWTLSYRVDSDVFVPYGYLRPRAKRAPPSSRLALPRKTKLAAWVISNWDEDHARVHYYRQLKNYLPVDVYGAHGLELNGSSLLQTLSQYKFYLAFENSQHQDYITEKLWRNALQSWAVPIVLGPPRSNYELFIPSDSFIHIDDFSGPKELALYLKFLDKNKGRYRRYFAWRKHYDVQVTSFWDEHCCRVCDAVRTAGQQRKTMENLANWFER